MDDMARLEKIWEVVVERKRRNWGHRHSY